MVILYLFILADTVLTNVTFSGTGIFCRSQHHYNLILYGLFDFSKGIVHLYN